MSKSDGGFKWWVQERSRRFKPFVANRISEIQSITTPMIRKYVPTKINPADLVITNILTTKRLSRRSKGL